MEYTARRVVVIVLMNMLAAAAVRRSRQRRRRRRPNDRLLVINVLRPLFGVRELHVRVQTRVEHTHMHI